MPYNNYFGLRLDTTAPSGSISANAYYIAQGTVSITYNDDASKMKVWYSANQTGTTSDANYPSSWEAVAASKATSFSAEGTYYYHVQFVDAVGNESSIFNSSAIVYEVTGPAVSNVSINNGDAYTSHRANNSIAFSFSNPISGVVSGVLTGNIVGSPVALNLTASEISSGSATRNFTFTDGAAEGTQTVTVTIESAAGKQGTGSDSITLDTQPATGNLVIRNAGDTANVTGPVNYTNLGIRVNCTAADWASYTITGNFTESPISGNVNAQDRTNGYVFETITLSTGDGTKTINGTITDNAGNVTTLDAVSIIYDTTAPVIAASVDDSVISAQSVYNSTTLRMSVTEAVAQASYVVWLDSDTENPIANDSGNLPATLTITNSILATEGAHVIHINVTDTAGNTGTQTVNITLDLTGPVVGTVAITNHAGYIGGNDVVTADGFVRLNTIVVTASASDSLATVAKGYCWINNTASDTTIPSGATAKTSNFGSFAYSAIYTAGINEGGTNYAHVCYEDSVGNKTYAHLATAVIIDTTVPAAGSITNLPAYCHTVQRTITITPSDTNISVGTGYYKLWGDITEGATEQDASWHAYTSANVDIEFTGSTASSNKTINLRWRDAAGNVQTATAVSATTELDTVAPTASLLIYDATNTDNINNTKRALNTFVARISGTDDTGSGQATAYLVYGDISGYASTVQNYSASDSYSANDLVKKTVDNQDIIRKVTTAGTYATWEDLVAASTDAFQTLTYDHPQGSPTYYLLDSLTCVSGDGQKTIWLQVRDNAGNVSVAVSRSFVYDTTLPEVNIDTHDRDVISKVHILIGTASETYPDKEGYADFVKFEFSPSEKVIEWKVCAYADRNAANQGSHEDSAIGTTNGSVNMTGSDINAGASKIALINGADYEAALGGTGHDGAHFVVVYVKDEAGQWSAAASIPEPQNN